LGAGQEATLILLDFLAQMVMAIDVLNRVEQELIISTDEESVTIENLMVKDYPIILRLAN
jgi:hypothetical protein